MGFCPLIVLAVASFVLLPTVSEAGGCGCPPLWTAFDQNCYRLFSIKNLTWYEAEMHCRGFSVPCSEDGSGLKSLGHLVSVHSQDEMDFLATLYESVRTKWGSVPTDAWLGFHDKTTEGTFEWSDGSSVDYTNWNTGEPNSFGGDQDCGVFRAGHEFKWHDYGCHWDDGEAVICKLPKW